MVKDGRYTAPHIPEDIYADLGIGMNERDRLSEELKRVQGRIHNWLDRFFPEVAMAGAYFGQDVRGIVGRLPDGGWNCEAARRGGTTCCAGPSTCAAPDEQVAEAIDLVKSKRDADGRWPLENPHPGEVYFDMDEGEGRPSRWNTLRAMRVLRWYDETHG